MKCIIRQYATRKSDFLLDFFLCGVLQKALMKVQRLIMNHIALCSCEPKNSRKKALGVRGAILAEYRAGLIQDAS
jgi:hypothetical protein